MIDSPMPRHDFPIEQSTPGHRAAFLALLGVCLCYPGLVHSAENLPAEYSRPVLIRFEGPITPILEHYLYRKLDTAKDMDADLVIVEIHSPGGWVDQSLNVAARLRDLDWARTVAYVPQQALSGAAFVALGCDEIIMHPNAKLGDAGPIYQAEGRAFREVPAKFRTHLVAEVRDLAVAKGRPPALAEAMVDKELEVFRVKNRDTDKQTFMSEKEIASDQDPDKWIKINPVQESLGDNFLEVSGTRAVQLDLAEDNASGREDLKRRYQLPGELPVFEFTGVDTAVLILNSPWVTGLLFVVGLVALYVELSAPGIGVGGLTAGLCFAIFFWSRFLGGTADVLDIILFASGIAFLLVELFVLPGFGVAGLTGILLILSSLILASQTFLVPRTKSEWAQLNLSLLVILLSGLAFACAAYFLSRYFGSLPILGRLVLVPPGSAGSGTDAVAPGGQSTVRIGSRGTAVSALRPAGKARFGKHYIDVVTDGEFITKGSRVEVREIHGNRIVVGPAEETA